MNLFCSFVRRPTGDEYGNVRKTEQTKSEKVSDADEELRIREDVQAAMEAIGYRSKEGISLEKGSFEINLKGAFLRHAKLDGVDLSGALFGDADFAHAEFLKANLSNAVFGSDANLSETKFKEANLSGAGLSGVTRLWRTNFSSADLSNASLMGANLSKAVLGQATLSGTQLDGANLSGTQLYSIEVHPEDTPDCLLPAVGLIQSQLDNACADEHNPPMLDGVVLDTKTGEPLVWGSHSNCSADRLRRFNKMRIGKVSVARPCRPRGAATAHQLPLGVPVALRRGCRRCAFTISVIAMRRSRSTAARASASSPGCSAMLTSRSPSAMRTLPRVPCSTRPTGSRAALPTCSTEGRRADDRARPPDRRARARGSAPRAANTPSTMLPCKASCCASSPTARGPGCSASAATASRAGSRSASRTR